jgi:polo-like kinase 1
MLTSVRKDRDQMTTIEEKISSPNGGVIIKKYSKGKFLGKGGFAKCYEFTLLDKNKTLAAKIIPKASLKKTRHKQKLLSEIRIHRSLNHRHIVKFEHVFEDNENVYILLEMCTNQTLNDLCKRRKRLSEFEAQYYLFQMVDSLQYLQKNRIIHRDLKLGNLFLSDKLEIKLGDFGLAARLEFDNEKRHTVCGTPNYLAPEVLNNKTGHSYEVDIWSLGVVLYALVLGRPPFETTEVKKTYEKIKKCNYHFPEHTKTSDKFKNIIKKIFQLDPAKRPTLTQILEDPFLNNGVGIPKTMHISTLAMYPTPSMMEQLIARSQVSTPKQKLNSKAPENVYIKKWVDYSSKYGLGYLLSNQTTGVFFNDCTKIIFHPEGQFLQYIEKNIDKGERIKSYQIQSYPQEIHKKVTLLFHFRSYLQGKSTESYNFNADAQEMDQIEVSKYLGKEKKMIYLKKWMKTKHASLLRLSNKIVQVAFNDKTEIILSSENKIVTYVNKKGERLEFPIGNALDSSNTEMARRLRYTKEILTHMLNEKKKRII